MIVKELIEMLSVLDQEAVVVLQKDPEGNSFSHIEGADGGAICVEANDDLEGLCGPFHWAACFSFGASCAALICA